VKKIKNTIKEKSHINHTQ